MPSTEYLELTDWRRAIAALYGRWRIDSPTDPEGATLAWREARDRLYREHPQSPVPVAVRPGFRDLWWPYDAAWRLTAVFERDAGAAKGSPPWTSPISMPCCRRSTASTRGSPASSCARRAGPSAGAT